MAYHYDPSIMLDNIAEKFQEAVYTVASLMAGRDKHLLFTLSGLPIEPNLVTARSLLRIMESTVRTERAKKIIKMLREDLESDMDAYALMPVPVESLVKGKRKMGKEMPMITRIKSDEISERLKSMRGEIESEEKNEKEMI